MDLFELRVASGPRDGQLIPLPPGGDDPAVLCIGRGVEAQVRFDDTTMSRVQAELRWEQGAWWLRNCSKHGSYVGRKRLDRDQQRKLRPGDTLLLGETELVFERGLSLATPGADPLTPETPTIASPPSQAGYDAQGKFHSGQTLMNVSEDETAETSVVYLASESSVHPELKVKTRQLLFLALVLAVGGVGCLMTGVLIVLPTLVKHPGSLLLATAFGLLPTIPYAALIKFLDRNDQIPWRNMLACIVWGATAGCGLSLVLNSLGGATLSAFMAPTAAWNATAILIAPLVEEACKGLAVLVVFWILHDEFDNALEGLVLGAASGLGFALVENCVYNLRFVADGNMTFLVMGTYRMVVNALIGHPVYTAMTGAGLGFLRETPRSQRLRYLFPFAGLAVAIGLHVSWNAAAVYLGQAFGGGLLTLVLTGVIFGGAGLLLFVAAYVAAASRERRVLVTYLGEEVSKGFVEPHELASFQRPLGRLRYELGGLVQGGLRVYWERKALRRTQVELALRKWHLAQGDAPKGQRIDRTIREARFRIRDRRNQLNALEGRAQA